MIGGWVCSEHGNTLIWEPGGHDMPTIHGRWYCPTCQELLEDFLAGLRDTPTDDAQGGRADG